MWVITILLLLAGGLIAASSVVIAKRPDAKDLIDKLVPFQGVIGVVLLLWGVRGAIDILRTLSLIHFAPFWWLVYVATVIVELGLGFLLAYGLIMKLVGSSAGAAQKTEQLRSSLVAYQTKLGIAAIVLALLFLFLSLTSRY